MKKQLSRFGLIIAFLVIFLHTSLAQGVLDRLKSLPDIVGIEKMEANPFFKEAYIVKVKQPIDHQHPEIGHFTQRVVVSHLDVQQPVVYITEGYGGDYGANNKYLNELCPLLNANQIFVEHRYFGKSCPDSLDWNYLTVKNAAADHHHVVELFKKVYTKKWISTGISKGGETVLYHRALYPNDVFISVPYVAPLNFSVEETRHDHFIREKAGTKEEREQVAQFQKEVLLHKKTLMPLFENLCNTKKYHFRVPVSEIYDYTVLEFAFSFWQWGRSTNEIPKSGASDQQLFDYLTKVASPDYFDIESSKPTLPFFVQATKELGYYGYNPKPFDGLIDLKDTHQYITRLWFPEGTSFNYDPTESLRVKEYLKRDARRILLIYGGNDPWSASAAETDNNRKILKLIQPDGSHRTRIGTMNERQKKIAMKTLNKWLKE